MTVYAWQEWPDNAAMIEACAELGYLKTTDRILDPTWGLGRFWERWRPEVLHASDLDPIRDPGGVSRDFRNLIADGHEPESYDAVVFDPRYKLNGTASSGGAADLDVDYGAGGSYKPWQEIHTEIRDGITECMKVLKPKGHLLVKCQSQVCSGQVRWQDREFADHAEAQGARLVDRLWFPGAREQPSGRTQRHARQNASCLLVLRKDARTRR